MSGQAQVNFSPAATTQNTTDITIWCTSQSQASGLLAAYAATRAAQRDAVRTRVAASRSPRASSSRGGPAPEATPPRLQQSGSAPVAASQQRGSINVSPPQQPGRGNVHSDAHSVAASRASAISTLPPPPGEPGGPPPVATDIGGTPDWSPTGISDDSPSAARDSAPSTAFDGVSAGGSGMGAGWDVASVTSYGTSASAHLRAEGGDSSSSTGYATPVRRPHGFRRLVPGQHSGGTHTPEAANAQHSILHLQVSDLPRLPPFNDEFAAARAGEGGGAAGAARAQEAVKEDTAPAAAAGAGAAVGDDEGSSDADTARAIKNARHRYNVYTEIYETEKAYVAALQCLVHGTQACPCVAHCVPAFDAMAVNSQI